MEVRRLDSITGLRFLAALLVVGYHSTLLLGERVAVVDRVLGHGWVGVPFFFVLSGFVLTWSHRDGDRTGSFLRRRWARIYPLHAATWLVALVVSRTTGNPYGLLSMVATLGLVQSWIPRQDVYYGMNSVSWTLACEAFFYVLFPIALHPVLRRLSRVGRGSATVIALAAMLALAVAFPNQADGSHAMWAAAVLPLSRLPEFVLGILLALEVRERGVARAPSLPVVLAGAAAVYLLLPEVPGSLVIVTVTVLSLIVIRSAVAADLSGMATLWSRPRLVRLGEQSFALYLVHMLVFKVAGLALPHETWPLAARFVLEVVCVVAAVLIARVAHERIEAPAERRFRPRGGVAGSPSHSPRTVRSSS